MQASGFVQVPSAPPIRSTAQSRPAKERSADIGTSPAPERPLERLRTSGGLRVSATARAKAQNRGVTSGERAVSPRDGRDGCALCTPALAGREGQGAAVTIPNAAYYDDDLIVLVDTDSPCVLVAPRSHTGMTPANSAVLLATLRRAAIHVERSWGTTAVTIEPGSNLPGAVGHPCYRVAPRDDSLRSAPGDPADELRRLVQALRDPTRSGGVGERAVGLDPR